MFRLSELCPPDWFRIAQFAEPNPKDHGSNSGKLQLNYLLLGHCYRRKISHFM